MKPSDLKDERLDNKIKVSEEKLHNDTPCWEWTGWLTPKGYGQITRTKKTMLVHRYVYELAIGDIPKGLQLDHLCRNRKCCNPAHLEPVTPKENCMRGEGIPAINAAKTSCPHGHEYTAENTVRAKDGRRICRACHNKRNRDIYYRNKARLSSAKVGKGE